MRWFARMLCCLILFLGFARAETTPAHPSFRNDVMPVFFRAGCNAGTCHGSARGKGGFQLSLFGYDPAGDYRRVVDEMVGRRLNLAMPEQSLLLLKATGKVPHTGGKLFTPESAATHLLGVVDGLTSADTGGFFAWDGSPIPF